MSTTNYFGNWLVKNSCEGLIMIAPIKDKKQLLNYKELSSKLADALEFAKKNNIEGPKISLFMQISEIDDEIRKFEEESSHPKISAQGLCDHVKILHIDPSKINIVELFLDPQMTKRQLLDVAQRFRDILKGKYPDAEIVIAPNLDMSVREYSWYATYFDI